MFIPPRPHGGSNDRSGIAVRFHRQPAAAAEWLLAGDFHYSSPQRDNGACRLAYKSARPMSAAPA